MTELGHLRSLVAEVKEQPVPELSQRRMRARLMAEFERTRQNAQRARSPQRSRRWLPVFALSGAVLGALSWQVGQSWHVGQAGAPQVAESVVDRSAASPQWLDGASINVGDRVAAVAHEVTVNHAAVAKWSLAAGSAARLLSLGDEVRIELEAGTLSAAVVPRAAAANAPRSDFFVVRAFGTEVSVHGTRFRVSAPAAPAQPVRVEVDEGVVRVRPVGEAGGVDLAAGARAEFIAGKLFAPASALNAEPAPSARFDAAPRVSAPARTPSERPLPNAAERPEAAAQPAAAPTESSPEVAPGVSAAPSADTPAAASDTGTPDRGEVATVIGIIQSCFHRYTRDRGDVRIQALSRLELDVLPNGRVLSLDLDPPLSPDIQQCADREVSALRLKPSATGYRIKENIGLSTE